MAAIQEPCMNTMHSIINARVDNGTYCIGTEVCATSFSKYHVCDGDTTTKDVKVYRCKVPISDPRQKLLRDHMEAGVMRNLDSNTISRCLRVSHDHADIAGHSWMTEVLQVLYDENIFLRDDEYTKITGRNH